MKQFGLALQNYHDTLNTFPASAVRTFYNFSGGFGATDSIKINGRCFLWPYVEQTARYDLMVSAAQAALPDQNPFHLAYETSRNWAITPVAGWTFPSDPLSDSNREEYSPTNYGFVVGDAMFHNGWEEGATAWVDWAYVANRALFIPCKFRGIGFCTDGTSNTIAMAETCVCPGTGDRNSLKGGIATLNYTGPEAVTPAKCITGAVSSADPRLIVAPYADSFGGWRGLFVFDGQAMNSAISTNVPPNGPACSFSTSVFGGAQSYHSGGVNAVFADGSVHFISETIDCGDQSHLQVMSGTSPYGVWGALGTPNGGESKTL